MTKEQDMHAINRPAMAGKGRAAVASALALLALLLLAPAAGATYNPIGSGTTKIRLDKGFLRLMAGAGVKLSARAPAQLKAGVLRFPASGGKFDPTDSKGTVEHEGALLFVAGGRRLPLKALQLKTTQMHAPFSVKVGGGQLKLAQAKRLAVSRHGFDSEIKVSDLRLSAKVAGRLGKKLALRGLFKPGLLLGSSVTKVAPVTVAMQQSGKISLTVASGFAAKLQSLFVAVNPIFPAEHPGPFTLPIFEGTLAPDASSGRLATQGSLEFLQLGGGQVFWHEPSLDFGAGSVSAEAEIDPSPPYGGKVGSVPIATLAAGAISNDPGARTITDAGAPLGLGAAAAALFNQAFAEGKEVFTPGEALGALSFTVEGE
jgi:hypothetical protein